MEFEGKEYSNDFISRLKEAYLKVNRLVGYPVKKEFGISVATAERLMEKVIPIPKLETVEDVWALYKENPTEHYLRRVFRVQFPIALVLENTVGVSVLRDMYMENNMSVDEILGVIGLPPTVTKKKLQAFLSANGIVHKDEDRRVNQRKSAVAYHADAEKVANAQKKAQATSMKRHGFPNPMQNPDIVKRMEQNNLKRIGVTNPMKLKTVQEKMRKTSQERHGTPYPAKLKWVQDKMRKTSREHYGVDNFKQGYITFSETEYARTRQEALDITQDPETLKAFLYHVYPDRKTFTLYEVAEMTGRAYSAIGSKFHTGLDFIIPEKQRNASFKPTRYVTTVEQAVSILETEDTLQRFLMKNFPNQSKFTLYEISQIVGP